MHQCLQIFYRAGIRDIEFLLYKREIFIFIFGLVFDFSFCTEMMYMDFFDVSLKKLYSLICFIQKLFKLNVKVLTVM